MSIVPGYIYMRRDGQLTGKMEAGADERHVRDPKTGELYRRADGRRVGGDRFGDPAALMGAAIEGKDERPFVVGRRYYRRDGKIAGPLVAADHEGDLFDPRFAVYYSGKTGRGVNEADGGWVDLTAPVPEDPTDSPDHGSKITVTEIKPVDASKLRVRGTIVPEREDLTEAQQKMALDRARQAERDRYRADQRAEDDVWLVAGTYLLRWRREDGQYSRWRLVRPTATEDAEGGIRLAWTDEQHRVYDPSAADQYEIRRVED